MRLILAWFYLMVVIDRIDTSGFSSSASSQGYCFAVGQPSAAPRTDPDGRYLAIRFSISEVWRRQEGSALAG